MIVTFEYKSIVMKKLFLLLSICSIVVLSSFTSETKRFEGDIIYSITYVQLPDDLKGYESMLPGEITMTISGNKSMLRQEVMGGSQTIISDETSGTGEIMMDMMGQKFHIKLSKEDIEKEEESMGESTVKSLEGSKTILGYKCQKGQLINGGQTIDVWYTKQIDATHKEFEKLNGFPLEYETEEQGMKMRITATKVAERKVDPKEFAVPEGYTTYTMAEFEKLMGGGY
jgi:GLPGLI family protein|tara:strand:- start:2307 stop:2990 length:684 start_codon:yes stop_codon:yes gene_type:complete